jgi:DNA-binding Xre family transcriptional regulator
MNIQEMVAELVERAGGQVQAAEMAGLNQCTISRLKSGATGKQISADTLNKIKNALTKVRRRKKNDGN